MLLSVMTPKPAYLSGYQAIKKFYGDRVAERSRVPLINHINEGMTVLRMRDCCLTTINAFCLHPLYQADDDLLNFGKFDALYQTTSYTVLLVMEYRNVANRYLSHHTLPPGGVQLSPLREVNEMLIADKVQNRKDFELYHKESHPRSERLCQYFSEWLVALGVSETQYQEYVEAIK
jgi:hypothetical protein